MIEIDNFFPLNNLKLLALEGESEYEIPETIFTSNTLEELSLDYKDTTILSPKFFEIKTIRKLSLTFHHTKLLPDLFDKLPHLEYLFISANELESLPDSISECNLLKELSLEFMNKTNMPESYNKLNNLKILNLHDLDLDSFDKFNIIFNLTNLINLSLSACSISFDLNKINNLLNLKSLSLIELSYDYLNDNDYYDLNLSLSQELVELIIIDVPFDLTLYRTQNLQYIWFENIRNLHLPHSEIIFPQLSTLLLFLPYWNYSFLNKFKRLNKLKFSYLQLELTNLKDIIENIEQVEFLYFDSTQISKIDSEIDRLRN